MGLDIFFYRVKKKEVGYFRKVNFLVNFFEKRGFDTPNQTPLQIHRKDAEELLDACNQVLADHSKAPELLPTMEGFFFGETDYDDLYFGDVLDVKIWVTDKLLPAFDKLEDDESIYFETWY
jgi:hypothetical protein